MKLFEASKQASKQASNSINLRKYQEILALGLNSDSRAIYRAFILKNTSLLPSSNVTAVRKAVA